MNKTFCKIAGPILGVLGIAVAYGWAWIEHQQPQGQIWWGGPPTMVLLFVLAIMSAIFCFEGYE